jgi:hypothetical protein
LQAFDGVALRGDRDRAARKPYVGQTVPWNPSENFSHARWQQELNFLGESTLTTDGSRALSSF